LRPSNYEDTVWQHEIMAPLTCVYLMCGSQLTLAHGSKWLLKTKLLIMRERIECYIAVLFRFPELSVCGWGREHDQM